MSDYWFEQRRADAHFARYGTLLGLKPVRVIVTGSRALTDAALVEGALTAARCRFAPQPIVVVHGGADGADELADVLAPTLGMTIERWPADWTGPCRPTCRPGHRRLRQDGAEYCPAAGNYRNQEMVDAGADLVIGFPVGESTGTRDCLRRAKRAGIPAKVYESGDPR